MIYYPLLFLKLVLKMQHVICATISNWRTHSKICQVIYYWRKGNSTSFACSSCVWLILWWALAMSISVCCCQAWMSMSHISNEIMLASKLLATVWVILSERSCLLLGHQDGPMGGDCVGPGDQEVPMVPAFCWWPCIHWA